MMRFAAMFILMLGLAPFCRAQGEDAYAAKSAAISEPDQARTVVLDSSQPPSATAPSATRKGRWWGHLIPTDRSLWLLSYVADATQFSYSEVDAMTTQHIKSGKGMREGRLAVKMLAGAGALGSLISEVRKSHAKRPLKSH